MAHTPAEIAALIRAYAAQEHAAPLDSAPLCAAADAVSPLFDMGPMNSKGEWLQTFCDWANGLAKAVERGNVPEVGEIAPFGTLERLIGLDVHCHRWGYVAVYAVTCDASGVIRFRSPWYDGNPEEADRALAGNDPAAYLAMLASATDFDTWPDAGADYSRQRQLSDHAQPGAPAATPPIIWPAWAGSIVNL